MILNELIDAGQVAEHFDVTVGTVNSWVREGRIPYIRASRKVVRFIMADVEAALSHKPLEERRGHAQRAEQAATVTVESRQPEGETT